MPGEVCCGGAAGGPARAKHALGMGGRRRLRCSRLRTGTASGFGLDHGARHVGHLELSLPAQPLTRPARLGAARANLGRAQQARIDLDMPPPVQAGSGEGRRNECLDRVALAGGEDEVLRLVRLQHPPHRVDIFGRPAPVASTDRLPRRTEPEPAAADGVDGCRHLPGHEALGAQWRLVIELDARAGEEPVGFPVARDLPEGGGLGDGIGAARRNAVPSLARPSPVSPKHSPEPAL